VQLRQIPVQVLLLPLQAEAQPLPEGVQVTVAQGVIGFFFAEHLGQPEVFVAARVGIPQRGEVDQPAKHGRDL